MPPTKRLLYAKQEPRKQPVMFEPVQEIAIYMHRFHNLDLFQQGWYQIKITMRWEDGRNTSPGTPARVVQYEALDLGSDDIIGIWRIDDKENSFSTQPFRIKYARQDVLLSVMISFNIPFRKFEVPATSAVILKFELLYTSILENGNDFQASLEALPSAVHEFRIPPKGLLGLHSYLPVHFDTYHAVLVDSSVHVTLLKAGAYTPPKKVSSDTLRVGDAARENCDKSNQVLDQGAYGDSKQISLLKALLIARDILLEELQKLSKAIGQKVDLTDFISNMGESKLISPYLLGDPNMASIGLSNVTMGMKNAASEPQNSFEKPNGSFYFRSDEVLQSLTKENLSSAFLSMGNQLSFLWNVFLKFHRANKTKILEFLRDAWANDRRAEWSIWMVYSKVHMPHHYLRSGNDLSSQHSVRGGVSIAKKLNDDPAESAQARAELHRRSIAQMRINNRSVQDMHIFGDPLRVPVLIVERVTNAPFRTTSGNSYFSSLNLSDTPSILIEPNIMAVKRLSAAGTHRNDRVLRVVVFVHGFQGHHLDLRLVRNQWLLIDPGAEFLMSAVNEEKTSGDFREMGSRLAEEVTSFLKKKIDRMSRSEGFRNIKLSFVGHSIGNIIIRTALTELVMEPFLKYLYTYLSMSGPHLGYLYCPNSLFNSGLWLLKKLKGSQCIHQLTFTDDSDLQNTFFYKLCKRNTLENFKNIILLSSPQDGYVPYHSARIELCHASLWDYSKKGKIFMEMLSNCLDQICSPSSERRTFMRCDVNFDTSSHGKNLDTFIGRAAHIEFLETDIFARFLMWSFPELFQ
ncbi:protein FAM135A-like isoform X2 [Telopea speciosissima]|uniref:protein FAM135A-like isoform X2 n=1 Tax=Telopea speciosissima TaxID=54955 RepID=UPI001CC7F30F|nr:protein FAM135A-like isoform X2 [Telopea speciosissima]